MGIREFPGGTPRGKGIAISMRRSPDVSPRRLSDISPQLRQLKYLVVDEAIKEDLKWSRSVEDLTGGPAGLTSIEERILRITGYYGYQPWAASYKREERPRDGPGPAEAPAGAEAGRANRSGCRCSGPQLRKLSWGLAVVLCVCASWAGSTQLAKLTFQTFDAPFTLTWFATTWNCLFFPLYYAGHVCKAADRQSVKQRYRECCRFFGDNGLTLKVFFTKAAPFGVLWTLTNYLYLHAIKKINTTDVSVLFCCNKAFVFLLSWIVLRDRFMGVRIVAAILAIAGIVMMTYADGFHSHSVIGIALVVGSASMSALYKVLFKLLLGSAKFGEAALFLSILGVFNVLFITCIPVILYFTKVEYWSSFNDIPWGNLCGFSVLLLTFNIVLNFGIAVTYPTLMSLGIVLSVPVNAVVDHYTSEIVFNGVRVIAIIIIGLGFLLLLLPEEWDVWLVKLLTRLKVRKKEETAEGGGDLGSGPRNKSRRARPSFAR
ncbi:solute carrier family 35 member F3 [Rhinolophus ferrumequinum]|uniref:Solute carrier family 35 member F3 n=1 Tax=Rhinolophus ferrumequinum TaxID=59479 RepID=A0A671G6C3_RHIFE|nr:PREDICTED: putative thiamine transporter SLC35F3 isoform X1 [Rhinolophus sinicus]XP_032955784.1 putative thiamine transporter SLC35F3 isoform X1 [Rhinolophus ferrumequinum]KAF6274788.1 solute carrier family 35 member F3 [Rhinolophus ferrumequinum]